MICRLFKRKVKKRMKVQSVLYDLIKKGKEKLVFLWAHVSEQDVGGQKMGPMFLSRT